MTSEPYTYTQDPGHGWIAVPLAELRELGIADQITSYSYAKNGTAYLEEDQDATTWSRAFEAKHGHRPDLIEKHVNSTPIRRYAQYVKPCAPDCPTTRDHCAAEYHGCQPDESALVFPEHYEQISDADPGL